MHLKGGQESSMTENIYPKFRVGAVQAGLGKIRRAFYVFPMFLA